MNILKVYIFHAPAFKIDDEPSGHFGMAKQSSDVMKPLIAEDILDIVDKNFGASKEAIELPNGRYVSNYTDEDIIDHKYEMRKNPQHTDRVNIMNPKYYITLKLPNFQRPTVP